ncbi:MAG TPA: response regulator transcription factor, partial [Miltoncostaeaceae bacterium]|nr:response regulator transcription factor [Miltoncostaeaceae bacterium]
ESRAHRSRLTPDEAAQTLAAEVGEGRLDADAADAVLGAAGHRGDRPARPMPAGLTEREGEVLGLLARGLSNRLIANRLDISPKTVGHHVAHVYDKIGVSTRAGAALFAAEHDLLAP